MQDELHRKESKYSASLSKLQEQVKFLERENQHLHEENHKLKLRGVTSKVIYSMYDRPPSKITLKSDEKPCKSLKYVYM